MTIRIAIEVLILLTLATNLILTYGLMRKIRYGLGPRTDLMAPPINPTAGHVVDPGRDTVAWPTELLTALNGDAVVILSVPGCPGCETVKRELETSNTGGTPVWVLVEPAFTDPEAAAYLETWPERARRIVAPDQFELMASFNSPRGYPVVMALSNGVVTASGYRLRDVLPSRIPPVGSAQVTT